MAPTSRDRVPVRDVAAAVVFAAALTAAAFALHSSMAPPTPSPSPVARVTTDDLEVIADLLRTLDARPGLTPSERQTVDRVADAVEQVEAGVIEVVPEADPLQATIPPPTTTTTTTTTTPVPRSTIPWPGEHDDPTVIP